MSSDEVVDLLVLGRTVLGLVFLVAAVEKVRNGVATEGMLGEAFGVRTQGPQRAARVVVVATETLLAVWLISGVYSRLAVGFCVVALVGFSLVLWRLERTDYDGGCGCFGILDGQAGLRVSIGRNCLLLAIAATTWIGAGVVDGRLPPVSAMTVELLLTIVAVTVALMLGYGLVVTTATRHGWSRQTGGV